MTPLVTQISWTNHLLIMSGSKSAEEHHFYMAICAKEHYSKRELERQIDSAYFERYMLSTQKPAPEGTSEDVRASFLDTYVLEFLDLPQQYSENNLRKAIIGNLKQFILEFGKDFTFVGEEYRVQVGGQDFFINLLFYAYRCQKGVFQRLAGLKLPRDILPSTAYNLSLGSRQIIGLP